MTSLESIQRTQVGRAMNLYLAGPDVFRPDAPAWAEEARQLCAQFGHRALIPLDGALATAAGIYQANLDLIRSADAVLANLNAFRGCEPDSGTCFELGFACALGKRLIGYVSEAGTNVERAARHFGSALRRVDGRPVDPDGWFVEDFGLPLNLMLAESTTILVGGLREALETLAACSPG